MTRSNPLIVAIDVNDIPKAIGIATTVAPHCFGFKFGLEFFCAYGASGIHAVLDNIAALLGKLTEELGEAVTAASRCLIQGIDESEPVSGKPNKEWLEEELADVWALTSLVINRFGLDASRINARSADKQRRKQIWLDELDRMNGVKKP